MAKTDTLADIVGRMPALDEGGKKGGEKGKLTGPPWPEAIRQVYDPVLAGGKRAVLALIDMLKPVDDGADYKVRYTLHGLSVYTCRKGKERQRADVIGAYATALGQGRPTPIRQFLVWELETVGDKRAVPALAALLADPTVGPDAVRSLVAIGDGAVEPLRRALAGAKGAMRLHLVQALGRMKDTASVPALKQAAEAKDDDLRITARWALATIGDAGSADLCLKGVAAADWERVKAVKACLLLAETLAGAGNKRAAADLYGRLKRACPSDGDAYIRDACDRGLKAVG